MEERIREIPGGESRGGEAEPTFLAKESWEELEGQVQDEGGAAPGVRGSAGSRWS